MSLSSAEVADRLRDVLEADYLNDDLTDRAEALLSRLASPIRLAVMGPRRTGKSTLFNVMAGAPVLPAGEPLPTAQLMHGDGAETICTYGNGDRRTFGAATAEELSNPYPIFIEMTRNLPALKRVALVEVVMDGSFEEKEKAMAWAMKRCDLVLWCTSEFGPDERTLWADAPDAMKQHSFLVLTKADQLGGKSEIVDRLSELKNLSDGQFSAIRPVSSNAALKALQGSVDKDALQKSGAQSLISGVLSEMEKGRAAIRDAALKLIADNPQETEDDVADLSDIMADVEKAPEVSLEDELSAIEEEFSDIVAEEVSETENNAPEKAVSVAVAPGSDTISKETRESLESVITYLNDRGNEFLAKLEADEKSGLDYVMQSLLDDAIWLTDFLAEPFHSEDPPIADLRRTATDTADLIQLMEMERNDSATVDATCLILQVKREMQGLLAA